MIFYSGLTLQAPYLVGVNAHFSLTGLKQNRAIKQAQI